MFEERFNRAIDRLWNWGRWQLGVIQGKAVSGSGPGFRPSFATGALVLAALAYQVVSGGLLLLYYQPSVYPTLTLCGQPSGTLSPSPAAWCSTYYILHSVPMGGVLLTSHLYGAYVVIFLLLVHLFRGFYAGAYKQPGGTFSWTVGTLLLLLVLGMGFTGYLLAYTQLSYNATQVSVTLLQSLPVIGPSLANLVLGDGTPQSLLSRMFAFHVILLPVAIVVLVFLHKRTPLFPRVFAELVKWGCLYAGVLLSVATIWIWPLPTYAGSPSGGQAVTVPAWYFLWVFKLVDFVGVTPVAAMVFALVLVLFLLFLPFLDHSHRTHPRDRPVFLFLANSMVGFFVLMTAWGDLTPGAPITPDEAALRLVPVLAGNALAVAYFYRKYRRSQAPPPWQVPPAAEPPPRPGATLGAPSPREPPLITPLGLSVLGLMASLFLLAFGLVLPFLLLLAAFLVSLAELVYPKPTIDRAPYTRNEIFPVVAFVSVLVLLGVLVLNVIG